jgi:hypothetical protein
VITSNNSSPYTLRRRKGSCIHIQLDQSIRRQRLWSRPRGLTTMVGTRWWEICQNEINICLDPCHNTSWRYIDIFLSNFIHPIGAKTW